MWPDGKINFQYLAICNNYAQMLQSIIRNDFQWSKISEPKNKILQVLNENYPLQKIEARTVSQPKIEN